MRGQRPAFAWCILGFLAAAMSIAFPHQIRAEEQMVTRDAFVKVLAGPAEQPAEDSPGVPAGLKLRGPLLKKKDEPKEIAIRIQFKYDSTELADDFSRRQLKEAGEAFSSPELKGLKIEIGGHTDAQGSAAYNLELSFRRAQAVKDFLCKGYVVDCAKLLVKGYGKSQPEASNDDEEGRAKNRRVVFKRLN